MKLRMKKIIIKSKLSNTKGPVEEEEREREREREREKVKRI